MSLNELSRESDASAAGLSYVQWGGIFAGGLIAAAVSLVLLSFGSAIGLAVTPLTPSWRTPTVLLGGLSGIWMLVIAVGSMSAGGYVAGRMRSTWHVTHTDEVEFRDGAHGLIAWAVAVTFGAILSGVAATALLAGAATGAAGDRDLPPGAPVPMAYEVDRLFRSNQGPVVAPLEVREEAGRLLVAATREPNFSANDRAQLIGLVVATARVPPEAAQARVNQSITSIRDKIAAARRAAVILAFVTAASLMAGAAAAWQAACIGGRHRDSAAPPSLTWRVARAKHAADVAKS
ncbi:hypothetical protein LJR219_004807 [Phenylobacterium sp. LjRoot219]|uniref:hypothetical protein n=1 Tax=Phenylobacterium sp. LjRoot219 TaxID=3342283 RepID=UPI003ECD71BD